MLKSSQVRSEAGSITKKTLYMSPVQVMDGITHICVHADKEGIVL